MSHGIIFFVTQEITVYVILIHVDAAIVLLPVEYIALFTVRKHIRHGSIILPNSLFNF